MRIAQVTDTHVPARPDAPTVIEVFADIECGDPVTHLQLVLADLAALEPAVELVVGTGDLADAGDPGSYRRWRELLLPLDRPIYVLPGNHDLADVLDVHLPGDGIEAVNATEIGPWLMLFVRTGNTEWGEIEPGHVNEIRAELERSDAAHVFVWIHHPPAGQHVSAHETLVRDDLRRALGDDPRVRGIAAGHVHSAADHEFDGIPVWTTPSTYLGRPGPGYRVFDLHDDGSIDTEVRVVPSQFTVDDTQRDLLIAMSRQRVEHEPVARRGAADGARAEVEGWRAAAQAQSRRRVADPNVD